MGSPATSRPITFQWSYLESSEKEGGGVGTEISDNVIILRKLLGAHGFYVYHTENVRDNFYVTDVNRIILFWMYIKCKLETPMQCWQKLVIVETF